MNKNFIKLSDQEIIRRKKLYEIIKLGINPYPSEEYYVNATSIYLMKFYEYGKNVIISGRIIRMRIMGKASFIEMKDKHGIIQIYLKRDSIKNYDIFFKKLLDIGDIIGIKGFLFKTKSNNTTVHAKKIKLLSKCLRVLPHVKQDETGKVHDSFSESEQRYRMRYLDLIVNDKTKYIFIKRTKIIQYIRNYLNKKGYLEVETPILQSIPGGAIARPFITHHNTLNIPLYLRISNELFLKKLIVGGLESVYEFSRNFRNEGIDKIHNTEFTILELYVSYKDYFWMMIFIEKMLEYLCVKIHNKKFIKIGYNIINFNIPFKKITILDSIKENTGYDLYGMDEKNIIKICKKINVKIDNSMGKGKIIDIIFSEKCEKKYINPTFIMDHPIEMSPLTKIHRSKKGLTERFELIINGNEIANSYSELNNPIDQLKRFREQIKLYNKGDNEAMLIDCNFIRSLEFGMPPCAGIGIGIDRLIMLLTNKKCIQDVLFFPQIK
ncbi:lysine--tRNA ligase [Candidatus Karelsulcia muelleri]|uniref:lysine--tRNA ligase n=1 Tax=Candidatus Karelsulcia muelleri TaxID=336810 RepID=UPI0035C93C67